MSNLEYRAAARKLAEVHKSDHIDEATLKLEHEIDCIADSLQANIAVWKEYGYDQFEPDATRYALKIKAGINVENNVMALYTLLSAETMKLARSYMSKIEFYLAEGRFSYTLNHMQEAAEDLLDTHILGATNTTYKRRNNHEYMCYPHQFNLNVRSESIDATNSCFFGYWKSCAKRFFRDYYRYIPGVSSKVIEIFDQETGEKKKVTSYSHANRSLDDFSYCLGNDDETFGASKAASNLTDEEFASIEGEPIESKAKRLLVQRISKIYKDFFDSLNETVVDPSRLISYHLRIGTLDPFRKRKKDARSYLEKGNVSQIEQSLAERSISFNDLMSEMCYEELKSVLRYQEDDYQLVLTESIAEDYIYLIILYKRIAEEGTLNKVFLGHDEVISSVRTNWIRQIDRLKLPGGVSVKDAYENIRNQITSAQYEVYEEINA